MSSGKEHVVVGYYEWSLKKCAAEVDTDFLNLRKIRSSQAERYLQFIGSLPRSLRPAGARAILRRFHGQALHLLDESPSIEERKLTDAYLGFRPTVRLAVQRNSLSIVDKEVLKGRITGFLDDVLGKPSYFGRGEFRYSTVSGSFVVTTSVDLGGSRPLTYTQTVSDQSGKELLTHLSALSWLGISSQTTWDLLRHNEIEVAASTLSDLCTLFVAEVPKMFGL